MKAQTPKQTGLMAPIIDLLAIVQKWAALIPLVVESEHWDLDVLPFKNQFRHTYDCLIPEESLK